LKRLNTKKDKDIDYSDVLEFDKKFLCSIDMKVSTGKKAMALRVGTDVLEWLKSQGKGHQSQINAVLRLYYEAHREDTPKL
jgi:uncharacterized protein (DUF4415 family)